jgi:ribosomal protein S12 methylthiotransferase accessory factor YcaO
MDKGLQVHCTGEIWQTLVTLNEQAIGVSRYHLSSADPFPCVHVELDVPLHREMGVFDGALGVLTAADKTALEAFMGESVEAWFAREHRYPPLRVEFAHKHAAIWLNDRLLEYVTQIEVWADFKESVTWVRWEGYPQEPETADTPVLTVQGHLIRP